MVAGRVDWVVENVGREDDPSARDETERDRDGMDEQFPRELLCRLRCTAVGGRAVKQ